MDGKRAKNPRYQCRECQWATVKWVGRCGSCHAWGAVEESTRPVVDLEVTPAHATPITEITDTDIQYRPTGNSELDRVLGGGLVTGAAVLFAGEPGVGKSTLLLELATHVSTSIGPTLYISAEETPAQVRARAERTGTLNEKLLVCAESDAQAIESLMRELQPHLVVVDSLHMLHTPAAEGPAGSITQVKTVTATLTALAKELNISTFLIGHVTKDGAIAGPRLLEHLVDVVCYFEGHNHGALRLLRSRKNRYGPSDEIGCFTMTRDGVHALADPADLFISMTPEPVSGTCLTVTPSENRPLLAEIQCLLTTGTGSPKITTSGIDQARAAMLLAVLQRRAGISITGAELYLATIGGLSLTEPAADLPLAFALASALFTTPLPQNLISLGEVGLAGEIRPVSGIAQRLREAQRLGITQALTPRLPPEVNPPPGMRIREVATVKEALNWLFPVDALNLRENPAPSRH